MPEAIDVAAEWLEADGLGGFASGTVGGIRTRRYHGLLLAARTPPADRVMLVNGFDAWVETPSGIWSLTSQRYLPDVIYPDNGVAPEIVSIDPWPTWIFELPDGTRLSQEIFVRHGAPLACVAWKLLRQRPGVTLCARPFLSGRDFHALQRENASLRFEARHSGQTLIWQTYASMPEIAFHTNAVWKDEPHWYHNFLYEEDRQRGQDCVEDLAAPGVLCWDLSQGDAIWLLAAGEAGQRAVPEAATVQDGLAALRRSERARRTRLGSPLQRAADAYIVRRGEGCTIIAGYPWFGDWGRDTFIAMRGLCLAGGRLEDARAILVEWSAAVSEGMLPNRFPDRGEAPDYNSVDASLWYVIVVHEFLAASDAAGFRLKVTERARLLQAVDAILTGYAGGTRFRIYCDEDGLLRAGETGTQLTWMDAKIGDWVVTPRIGKPVEVQCLWLNALWTMREASPRWANLLQRGRESFERRFWNAERGCLHDVVDCDHQAGTADARVRPNQIFAVGGLPLALLDGPKARSIVDVVEQRLLTPLGLRTLVPHEPGFVPHYRGSVPQRDAAYHQGTVWPWLLGPFVEAWMRVRGASAAARKEAHDRFLPPIHEHMRHCGMGHVSEVADATPPYQPGGCPFQAWSLGELMRLELGVLRDPQAAGEGRGPRPGRG